MNNNDIVKKLWNLCDILRDDGINYSDYVTELVLLLFIKITNETTSSGTLKEHPLPEGCRWSDLNSKKGLKLLTSYNEILRTLSTGKQLEPNTSKEIQLHDDPILKSIFLDAHTKIREPRHLEIMIKRLDEIEDWFSHNKDGLGDLYEGLLDKNANETKSGAGQYFTPRPLINSIVRCTKPQPGEIIQDPATGTAGFLISAHEYIKFNTNDLKSLNLKEQKFQKNNAYIGVELVPNTRRLALMNCLLHGIGSEKDGAVLQGNALGAVGKELPPSDLILANPPFGVGKGGEASLTRDDLSFNKTNKQLAFLQHIYLNLKPGGRAAVVVPDNVLFESGKGSEVRAELMNTCNVHTILRLPKGIFYAHGVQTNVIFFNKGSYTNKRQNINCTAKVWVYDLRTNMPNFGKRTPFTEEYLKPFENVFGDKSDGSASRAEGDWSFLSSATNKHPEQSRWRSFSRQWIADNNNSLDISWMHDVNNENKMDAPVLLLNEAKLELTTALELLDTLLISLGKLNDE
ncbi:N-6 DNA methylase [Pantoea agglomerans]|uniref:class I SAM-dependent DNA methyltransferase n=1 Tax=Enterobacter agglomerans TaxID=549 RepID=UPI003CEB1811